MNKASKNANKEYRLASWAIDNPTIIYVLIALFFTVGLASYFAMPREEYPEVIETKIYVSTVYPGNTAEDIERLVIDPLEDRIKNISNVTKFTSTSQEDYGMIMVEFEESVTIAEAKVRVQNEVDIEKASEDWPVFNGAKVEPNVFDLNIAESQPIMNVNLKGDYTTEQLKSYAEYLEDAIEDLPQIKEVDIRGAQDKEVEVAVDVYKMMASKVSFNDILGSIANGNMTLSAGNMVSSGQRRTIRILGEIEDPSELENFVVKAENGSVYLRDIAEVSFKEEERTTYARESQKRVVMLDIKKRSGQNAVDAAQQIYDIIDEAKTNILPSDLEVTITSDTSATTINQVDDLVNNIIFGVILVVAVLMFFLGFRNALFVGFAIPMSMFISFMILSALGYTLNTMILFGLIMGLGMLVDNGVVVVENVYRLMDTEKMSRIEAAKKGIGEIAIPIIISTATTVAAFVPLGTWPGLMGQFMIFFPITLSVVLGSSLFVAIFMNSMLVSQFMAVGEKPLPTKFLLKLTAIFVPIGGFIILLGGAVRGFGSLMIATVLLMWAYKGFLYKATLRFQNNALVRLENFYERQLKLALRGRNVYYYFLGTTLLLIVAFMGFGASIGMGRTKIEFFPDNTPKQVIIYIEYPQGTDIEKTNELTKSIEERVYAIINDPVYQIDGKNALVETAIAQVGKGAENPFTEGGSAAEMPHRGKLVIQMREFKERKGLDSEALRKRIQEALAGVYPGVIISVEKDPTGPPTGYPVNIEVQGDDYDELMALGTQMKNFINEKSIDGMEGIKLDVTKDKPALEVYVDRKKAGDLGVAVAQVGLQLRRSLFGEKAGIYKENGEDYDINVRFNKDLKYDKSALFEQRIIFRDPANGQIKEVPVSAVASARNTSGFSSIKHKNGKRVITLYSALTPGGNATQIVDQIQTEMQSFGDLPDGVAIDYTGQIEEQNKQQSFLMGAFFTGLALIFFILIFQFSGISKPLIIMIAIFLSLIGVFGGLMVTGWPFVIMMTMMGIIALAGIVVNNGVVLLDYTQILIDRKLTELGVDEKTLLDRETLTSIVISGGKARLRPVLLTAITTVLGLVPLAIGLNINFITMFTRFDPQVYVGGDNVIFWGPLAWTVIFGLVVATFLTLIIVPVLYHITYRIKWAIFKSRRIA
ncbi:MAG: Antibiotic efflux pump membrane transporter ArpB [Flavobacteriaceae bacterium]|nr:MAG: Antibiotic efflux pump membrane transporter ArpB [Flavobacteriaceae bacterium]